MIKFKNRINSDAHAFYKAMIWEFKHIIEDKAVFASFIGVALLVSVLYTYVYSNETLSSIKIGVVDNDNAPLSRQYLRMVTSSGQISAQDYFIDLEEAKRNFAKEGLVGIVVIPKDFSRKLQRGEQPNVSIYADAAYILYYKQIVSATQKAAIYMGAGVKLKKSLAKGMLPSEAKNSIQPIAATTVSLYNPSSGYGTFLIPVVLVIIFQTAMLTAIGILGGTIRESKGFYQIYPNADYFLGTLPIVLGKASTYLILSICILLVMLGLIMPYFGIPVRSDLLSIIVFMIPYLLSLVYLGVFLLSFFKRREDAILFIMFTSLPTLLITGFSWPVTAMPDWIQKISYIVPSTFGTQGFVSITQMGAKLNTVQDIWIGMWLVCLFYLILATLSLKRLYIIDKNRSVPVE